MEPHRQSPEELLLDFHLDRLEEPGRSWLEAELQQDVELRIKSERLGQVLRPLDYWTVPLGPSSLIDKVLAGIERADHLEPAAASAAREGAYTRRSFSWPLREIVAVAACLVLLASVFTPGLVEIRGRAQRAMCASNLGSIFRGTGLYAQAFGGSLPFGGRIADAAWLPGGHSRRYASNSRHMYLLLKLGYDIEPDDFICPAVKTAESMRVDDLASHDDFASARNNSYDSLNLAGANPNIRPTMPIAYVSDANPLFKNGRFDDTVDPNTTNSPAHGGRGQTVLTVDGSVQWMTTPVYGARLDNLWLAGDIRHYTGTEAPASDDDAQLVPGYPVTDPVVQRFLEQ